MVFENFTLAEFACSCCDDNRIDVGFVGKLDEARTIAGVPFVITSGYRCPAHNRKVGGSPTSSHLTGYAADIACTNDGDRYKIVLALAAVGIDRIGIRKDFIHCDTDKSKNKKRLWLY